MNLTLFSLILLSALLSLGKAQCPSGETDFFGECVDETQFQCIPPEQQADPYLCRNNRLTREEHDFAFFVPFRITDIHYNVSASSEGPSSTYTLLLAQRRRLRGSYNFKTPLLCPPPGSDDLEDEYNSNFTVRNRGGILCSGGFGPYQFTYCGNGWMNRGEECDPTSFYPDHCQSNCTCEEGFESTLRFSTDHTRLCYDPTQFECGINDEATVMKFINREDIVDNVQPFLNNPPPGDLNLYYRLRIGNSVTVVPDVFVPANSTFLHSRSFPFNLTSDQANQSVEVELTFHRSSDDSVVCNTSSSIFINTCGNRNNEFELGEPCDYLVDGLEACTQDCQCRTTNGYLEFEGRCVPEDEIACQIKTEDLPTPLVCSPRRNTLSEIPFKYYVPSRGQYEFGISSSSLQNPFNRLIESEEGINFFNTSLFCPPPQESLLSPFKYIFSISDPLGSFGCQDSHDFIFTYCNNGNLEEGEECDPTITPNKCTPQCTCEPGTVSIDGRCLPNDTVHCQVTSESPLACSLDDRSSIDFDIYFPSLTTGFYYTFVDDTLITTEELSVGETVFKYGNTFPCNQPPVELGNHNFTLIIFENNSTASTQLCSTNRILEVSRCGDGIFQPDLEDCESTQEGCLSDCTCPSDKKPAADGSCFPTRLPSIQQIKCVISPEGLTNGSSKLCQDSPVVLISYAEPLQVFLTVLLYDSNDNLLQKVDGGIKNLDPANSPTQLSPPFPPCPPPSNLGTPPYRIETSVNTVGGLCCFQTLTNLTISDPTVITTPPIPPISASTPSPTSSAPVDKVVISPINIVSLVLLSLVIIAVIVIGVVLHRLRRK